MTQKMILTSVLAVLGLCTCARAIAGGYSLCSTTGPLGMITGEMKDWQITASSAYPYEWDNKCREKYARVYLENKYGWCAKYKSSSEWLQVDLGVASRVTGVMTQGRADGNEWVTAFMVSYSMNRFDWFYVNDQYGNQKVFEGNTDSYSVKHSYLDEPIVARFIKFHTVQWNRHPSMRVEILGCQLCKQPLGLPPYGKLTASSYKKSAQSCQPEDGTILSHKGWCAKKKKNAQWLQIDIGPPTLVTAVITKGRGDSKRSHWVKRFMLSYSNDSSVWYKYKDAHHLDPKNEWLWTPTYNASTSQLIPDQYTDEGLIFGGNSDKDTERIHYLNAPFVARFIRFYPIEWNKKIAMRVGLLGCPFKGKCPDGFMRVNEDSPCVENLAYKKRAQISSSSRHNKRHISTKVVSQERASQAVDGRLEQGLRFCTILDNLYGDVFTIDLGRQQNVNGVLIYTWQGEGEDGVSAYKDYMNNLDKLLVYVDDTGGKDKKKDPDSTPQLCAHISRRNEALFRPVLHFPCMRALKGQKVLIEAWNVLNGWNRIFSAVLCEVQIYG
ncbi:lactadherin-like isoform X1 [Ruditapes philippinarum]|uniref:lactadherin-like isoform X1 n=1 Tax=Ruditapes philippinarum TaxID=129788 RepID=UPI00295A61B1|nr:lactadherin-like isoform X1 [Ruditapes philippinarum]